MARRPAKSSKDQQDVRTRFFTGEGRHFARRRISRGLSPSAVARTRCGFSMSHMRVPRLRSGRKPTRCVSCRSGFRRC
jgi:hypothetical protein